MFPIFPPVPWAVFKVQDVSVLTRGGQPLPRRNFSPSPTWDALHVNAEFNLRER